MYVVVVGTGKIGSVICRDMAKEHEVIAIERNQVVLESLINQADISKLERGNANPSLHTLQRLAAGMGMRLKLEFEPITQA